MRAWVNEKSPRAGSAATSRYRSIGLGMASLILLVIFARSGLAQDWVEVERFQPTPPMPDSRGLHGIASDDAGTLAIGVVEWVPAAAGRVFVFRNTGNGYEEVQSFYANDPVNSSSFGVGLAIEEDWLIVGEANDGDRGNSAGAVHAYQYDGSAWVMRQKLFADDANERSFFGFAVALRAGRLFVGAWGDEAGVGAFLAGAVYVFEHDGTAWVQRQKIVAPTPEGGDSFGLTLASTSDRLLVGAPGDDDSADGGGAVYSYRFDGADWVLDQKLLNSDSTVATSFGYSVAAHGSRAVISMLGYDGVETNQGALYAYAFDGTAWNEEQRLLASHPAEMSGFGENVAMADGIVVAGARIDDTAGDLAGTAYVFRHDGSVWQREERLFASRAGVGAQFGRIVAVDGSRVLVCASFEDGRGHAYAFERATCMEGAVDAAGSGPVDVLFVGGSSGGEWRTVAHEAGDLLEIGIDAAPAGGNGKFVLLGNAGVPRSSTEVVLPASIGTACFELRLSLGASSVIVADAFGRPEVVGESMFFGTPTPAPQKAPVVLYYPHLPVGTVLTLQTFLRDPGSMSPRGVSATNAVIVRVL